MRINLNKRFKHIKDSYYPDNILITRMNDEYLCATVARKWGVHKILLPLQYETFYYIIGEGILWVIEYIGDDWNFIDDFDEDYDEMNNIYDLITK